MEIVDIFVDKNNEGLHSICLVVGDNSEYDKTFDSWYDTEYLLQYCKQHEREIFGLLGSNRIEDFIESVYSEVEQLEDLFLDFRDNYLGTDNNRLQQIFSTLDNNQSALLPLQPQKAKVSSKQVYSYPVLRLYAIRLTEKTFIVTGGCLKFTLKMDETQGCKNERHKLDRVRTFLKEINCSTQDDLNYYYDTDKEI